MGKHFQGEKFIENLSITYENSPEESKYYTVYELDTYGNVSDDLSEDLVGQIALYYNEFIKLERDEIRLKTYAADANQAFDTLLAELPKTIASVRAGIGEEEND